MEIEPQDVRNLSQWLLDVQKDQDRSKNLCLMILGGVLLLLFLLLAGIIIRISVCWDFEPLKVGSTPYRLGLY